MQINSIKTGLYKGKSYGAKNTFGNLLPTKRMPLDTSELYIKSSLNQIYNRTVADCFVKEKLGSIKNFVDKNAVDRNLKLA